MAVDDLSIIVGLDGLVLVQHPRGVVLEQLVTSSKADVILRELEAESRAERVQFDRR